MKLGNKGLRLAALAVAHLVTACSDYERFRGRTPERNERPAPPVDDEPSLRFHPIS
jgi:hypothetical protein